MEKESTYRTCARAKYPSATIIGDGAWGVVLDGGRIVDLYQTYLQAAWNGDTVEHFGPPARPQTFFRIPGEGIDE